VSKPSDRCRIRLHRSPSPQSFSAPSPMSGRQPRRAQHRPPLARRQPSRRTISRIKTALLAAVRGRLRSARTPAGGPGLIRRVLRWLAIASGVLVAILLVAYAAVHIVSERAITRTYPMPAIATTAASQSRRPCTTDRTRGKPSLPSVQRQPAARFICARRLRPGALRRNSAQSGLYAMIDAAKCRRSNTFWNSSPARSGSRATTK
jgi:hypothetical protein